jgi:hypothetical protein
MIHLPYTISVFSFLTLQKLLAPGRRFLQKFELQPETASAAGAVSRVKNTLYIFNDKVVHTALQSQNQKEELRECVCVKA